MVQRSKNSQHFQVMSDLHLEVAQQYADFQIPAKAPDLILTRGIGRLCDFQIYLTFLTKQCAQVRQPRVLRHVTCGGVPEPSLQGKMVVLNRKGVDILCIDTETGSVSDPQFDLDFDNDTCSRRRRI